jgi:WXG100 family type VII secretion target
MKIRIDTEQVREISRRVASDADRLAELGHELQQAIGSLDTASWDGQSRRRAEPLLDRIRPESARVTEGLMELGRKLTRVADAFERQDSIAARNLDGMPWVTFGISAQASAAGVTATEFLRERYYQLLANAYPRGSFTFGGQKIQIEDLTAEQLATAYHLGHMSGSDQPVTAEQLGALDGAFQVDFGEKAVEEWLQGKSQGEVWESLDSVGLIWDPDKLANPYPLTGGEYERMSLSQQFLVLASHYAPDD